IVSSARHGRVPAPRAGSRSTGRRPGARAISFTYANIAQVTDRPASSAPPRSPRMNSDRLIDVDIATAARLRTAATLLVRALRQTDHELTPSQSSVFGTINRHQPISISDLAAREHLSKAMVSR